MSDQKVKGLNVGPIAFITRSTGCPFYTFIRIEKLVFSDTARLDEFFDYTGLQRVT